MNTSNEDIDRLVRKHNRILQTESFLEKCDPNWRNYAKLFETTDGIQIDIGGFKNRSSYCASVILNDLSVGHIDDMYEVWPVFDGKNLTQLGLHREKDTLGNLTLEEALKVGLSAMSMDLARFTKTLELAMYAHPIEHMKIPFYAEINPN